MNKTRWRILWAICLLLSAIPITTGQVWAYVSQQPKSTATQMQGQASQLLTIALAQGSGQQNTKGIVNLLLQDEEKQVLLQQNVQIILDLLLEEEKESEGEKQVFLPLVTR